MKSSWTTIENAQELSALHERLQRETEKYDDGNWQTSPDVIE